MRLARLALPVYWVVLAFATHYPRVSIPTNVSHRDKVIHLTAFGLLAYLSWKFAETRQRPLAPHFVWTAAAVLLAYAGLDEYTQQFVGRDTDPLDFLANTIGITVVLAVLEVLRRRATSSSKS